MRYLVLPLLALTLSGCFDNAKKLDEFRVLDSNSGVHYAVIAKADVNKKTAIGDASGVFCEEVNRKLPAPQNCVVMVWSEIEAVPNGIDISDESRRALRAIYTQKVGEPKGEIALVKDGAQVP